jgi:hypothetical protein
MKKYLKVMLILVVALSLMSTVAFAGPFTTAMNNTTGEGAQMTTHVNKIGGSIISVIQTIGYIVAVVMVLYVGIQWLIGTPAKKQELKGRMWSLIIGAILIAGGVTILDWVAQIATTDMDITQNEASISVRV